MRGCRQVTWQAQAGRAAGRLPTVGMLAGSGLPAAQQLRAAAPPAVRFALAPGASRAQRAAAASSQRPGQAAAPRGAPRVRDAQLLGAGLCVRSHAPLPKLDVVVGAAADKAAGVGQRGQAPDGAAVRAARAGRQAVGAGGGWAAGCGCSSGLAAADSFPGLHAQPRSPSRGNATSQPRTGRQLMQGGSLHDRDARGGADVKDLDRALLGAHQRVAVAGRPQRAQPVPALHGAQAGAGARVPHLVARREAARESGGGGEGEAWAWRERASRGCPRAGQALAQPAASPCSRPPPRPAP